MPNDNTPDRSPLSGLRSAPSDGGLSLDSLNQAFQAMLSGGSDPYEAAPADEPAGDATDAATTAEASAIAPHDADEDDRQLTPRSILEAMLFVGLPDHAPLEPAAVSGMMRGVRPEEIDEFVAELNAEYATNGSPYTIVSVGQGYRLELLAEFHSLRDKVLGRERQARLSSAAIEVLSLVAYHGPQTVEQLNKLRGIPSNHVISQLVRRQLLAVERESEKPRKLKYRTTDRFLQLYGLKSLDELPRPQDPEPR
ncbi:MAG: SMC-Scp complex subunit ScpB [Planctomycetes bacterium]|nr:SMC-Scp complex subunit ScpB [Planctomycetota bacterium]